MSDDSVSVPLVDLLPEIHALGDSLDEALHRVIESGQYILGPRVAEFEEAVADYLGVDHTIGVNSGTDALVIALRACGVQPGDRVIVPGFTFVATAEAVRAVGAVPVFADVDPATANIDADHVDTLVDDRVRAVVPVHLFGHPADMEALGRVARRHDLVLIEDAAQAFGAATGGRRVGSLSSAGAFSFFPTKNLGAIGDGGMVVTSDAQAADVARMLRAHGSRQKGRSEVVGYNSRLDPLQAVVLLLKLERIERTNASRRHAAALYVEGLGDLDQVSRPEVTEDPWPVFHQFTVQVLDGRRDPLRRHLTDQGIASAVHYQTPVYRLPAYADVRSEPLPVTERLCAEVLSLPIWAGIPDETVWRVVTGVRSFFD
jgi:dTDP-4-amino-4,6-dideoxygalactose transaminase